MKSVVLLFALAGLVTPASGGGTWAKEMPVPGVAALNKATLAQVGSVSCASAGNCAVGGEYAASPDSQGLFVAIKAKGKWGKAVKVRGPAGINSAKDASIVLSCGSASSCGAVVSTQQPFNAYVLTYSGGKWGAAARMRGTGPGTSRPDAQVSSISCASGGNCSAIGTYSTASGSQALVITESKGAWGIARDAPGLQHLNQGNFASPVSISCGSAGNCVAAGEYFDASHISHGFVISEVKGSWGAARDVPGLANLNKGSEPFSTSATVESVSCGGAGQCAAGGYYTDKSGATQAFLVTEKNGKWGAAREVPGFGRLNTAAAGATETSRVSSISCASAGNCAAGGIYNGHHGAQAFIINEKNGHWGNAFQVPGTAKLNAGQVIVFKAVSCASVGNCSAAGDVVDASGKTEVFELSEVRGAWRPAAELPGAAALNKGRAQGVNSLSCGAPGNCSAGGFYSASASNPSDIQAFVASQS